MTCTRWPGSMTSSSSYGPRRPDLAVEPDAAGVARRPARRPWPSCRRARRCRCAAAAGSFMWRRATGRSAEEARRSRRRGTTRPADDEARRRPRRPRAATSAPMANGARKKPIVSTSPTPNTTAAMSQSTHSSMCARSLPGRHERHRDASPASRADGRRSAARAGRVLDRAQPVTGRRRARGRRRRASGPRGARRRRRRRRPRAGTGRGRRTPGGAPPPRRACGGGRGRRRASRSTVASKSAVSSDDVVDAGGAVAGARPAAARLARAEASSPPLVEPERRSAPPPSAARRRPSRRAVKPEPLPRPARVARDAQLGELRARGGHGRSRRRRTGAGPRAPRRSR